MLWTLLIVPFVLAVYIWAQRRRRRYALRYSSLFVVKEALTPGHKLRRHIPPAFFLLGLTAMFFSLARPQSVVILPEDTQTVILTIDVSGSMRARDITPNRIDAAKAAALTFINDQKGTTRIGIVAFSGTASIVQEPTTDRDVLITAVNRLTLERSTAIGSGILVSLNAIFGNIYMDTFGGDISQAGPGPGPSPVPPGTFAPATIILLTDGANVQGPSPRESAQKAADLGVRVFTIGVGNPSSSTQTPPNGASPQNSQSFGGSGRFQVDETTLRAIAEMTDGEYFLATNADALKEIYQKLTTQVVLRAQKSEVTFVVTIIGACLLLAATALSIFWFSRIP
ncbi:MAG: VWA domain-containing protein [Chloroflexi bacterium]|nr:VWA domain-containing protein [Chloroflexota bacterium]